MRKIPAQNIRADIDYESGTGAIRADMELKSGLLMGLHLAQAGVKTEAAGKQIGEIIDYLESHVIEIKSITPGTKPYLYRFTYSAGAREGEILEDVQARINAYLNSDFVLLVINQIMGTTEKFLEHLKEREERLKKDYEKLQRERERERKRGRVKVPKQLTEQELDKLPAKMQPGFWDGMNEQTRTELIDQHSSKEAAMEMINRKGEGINLSKEEEAIVQCITELLHEKSQNRNPKAPDYYAGNADGGPDKMEIQSSEGWTQTVQPKLSITVTEIARKFTGRDRPGGKDQETVKRILYDMAENPDKRCLMELKFNTLKGRRWVPITWKTYAPLWEIWEGYEEGQKTPKLVLRLNPVFRANIEHSFQMMPPRREIIEAYGGSNIPKAVARLITAISRAQSHAKKLKKGPDGTRVWEIGQALLFMKIAPECMPPNKPRYDRAKDYFNRGVETAIKLGMIAGVHERPAADSGTVYVFQLIEEGKKPGPAGLKV